MDLLNLARAAILEPYGLDERDIDRVLAALLSARVDIADIYFQASHYESWVMESGIIKEGSHSIEQGVGVRAVVGDKTGFAYSDRLELPLLLAATDHVKAILQQGQHRRVALAPKAGPARLYPTANPLRSWSDEQKIDFLRQVERHTRQQDRRVEEVIVSLVAAHQHVLVANQHGQLAADVRPLVRMNISVIAAANGRREQASVGGGVRGGYSHFTDDGRALAFGEEAVRQALVNLDAEEAPAGVMPVVLGPGWPGILLHEAIGHGLEGDFNRKGTSAFSGRVGERVASPLCTIVDDGSLHGRRGSLSIDDEGTPSQRTTLIEDGVLTGYLQDLLNARLMGAPGTGNGRRESYAHLPMPRMTNTFMLPGRHDPDEIIQSVDKGLYAKNFSGGQVDITSGKFVFCASEAYLIEHGKITRPVKGVTLIGNGPDVLTKVSMVGNDLALDPGVGTCGKDGQSVPVGVGQPTVKVDALTVGGTRV